MRQNIGNTKSYVEVYEHDSGAIFDIMSHFAPDLTTPTFLAQKWRRRVSENEMTQSQIKMTGARHYPGATAPY
jgi:hypothetical protein